MMLKLEYKGKDRLPDIGSRKPHLLSKKLRVWHKELRAKLLMDVANLEQATLERFWLHWRGFYDKIESDETVFVVRDELRQVWKDLRVAPYRFRLWTLWQFKDWHAYPWVFDPKSGLHVNPLHIRLSLIVAIGENVARMRFCQGPNCPTPYFLAYNGRKQRFCDHPKCSEYGQRLHKRRWWNENRGRGGKKRFAD